MRCVIQRTTGASLSVDKEVISEIDLGLLLLIGIEEEDTQEDIQWICSKVTQMRIFNDLDHKMNLSIQDVQGSFLVVSQFTLHASCKKGNRPSFIKAAKPSIALQIYQDFVACLQQSCTLPVKTGIFGADMKIAFTNDGPVTILLDSKNKE